MMMMQAMAPRALAMRRSGGGASGVMLTVRRQVMMTLVLEIGFAATGTVKAAAIPLEGLNIGGGLMLRGGGRSRDARDARSQLGAGMMMITMITTTTIKNFTIRRGRPSRQCMPAAISGPFATDAATHKRLRR